LDIEILAQPNLSTGEKYTLGERIAELLNSGEYATVSFYLGLIKEDVYEKLFPHFKNFILNGGSISFYLGYDKRRNLKKTIHSMLELGCDVFVCKEIPGNTQQEFQYKTIIFENSKEANALFFSGNFTMSGLYEGINTTLSFHYSFRGKGKEEFAQLKESILSERVLNFFQKAERTSLDTLLNESPLPSIEEFTHKDVSNQSVIETNLNDISIDIEIDENVDFLTPTAEPVKKVEKERPKQEPTISEEPAKFEPILDFSEEDQNIISIMKQSILNQCYFNPIMKINRNQPFQFR